MTQTKRGQGRHSYGPGGFSVEPKPPAPPPGKIIATLGAYAVEAVEGPSRRHYLVRDGKRVGVPTSRSRALKALVDTDPVHGNPMWTLWAREERCAEREKRQEQVDHVKRQKEAELRAKLADKRDELIGKHRDEEVQARFRRRLG
jgi:hypothetical protein